MVRLFAAAPFALAAVTLVAAPALAADNCGSHGAMIAMLAKRYKEAPKAVGLVNSDRVVQVFVSSAGTWTILATKPDGNTCIIAAGKDWEEVPTNMQSLEPSA